MCEYVFKINKHKNLLDIDVKFKDTHIIRTVPVNCVLFKEIRKAKKIAKNAQIKHEMKLGKTNEL